MHKTTIDCVPDALFIQPVKYKCWNNVLKSTMMGLQFHEVGRTRHPKLSVALWGILLVWFADCSSDFTAPLTRPSYPIGGTSTRPNDLTRRIQSWMIKQRAIPKTRSLRQVKHRPKPRRTPGSIFTFQRPTKAQVGRWFEADEDPGNPRCMLQRRFNHGKCTLV